MYSVVLAAMLTAGPTVMPGFGHGCHAGCGCGWSGGCCNWSGGNCGYCCDYGWSSGCCNWSGNYGGYNCGCGWSSNCCNWSGGYSGVTVAPTYPYLAGTAPQRAVFPSFAPGALDQPPAQSYTVPPTVPQMPTLPPLAPGALDQPSTPPTAVPLTTPQLPTLPQPQPQPPLAALSFRALVVVKAPLDAAVLANGQVIEHTQAEQTFITPSLKAGKTYVYEFRAEAVRDGKTVTLNQKVTVKAGQDSRADFSELSRHYAPALVTIKAPADARLTVDNVEVTTTARTFKTPTLENGRTYFYTVKAEMVRDGKAVRDSKLVRLEAGKEVKVDFEEPSVATAEK